MMEVLMKLCLYTEIAIVWKMPDGGAAQEDFACLPPTFASSTGIMLKVSSGP